MSKRTGKEAFSGKKKTGVRRQPKSKKPFKPLDESSGYYDEYPRWSFRRCDFEHPKWGLSNNAINLPKVFKYLASLESRKWGDILTDTSGRRENTRNHLIEFAELTREAQKRAIEITVDEFDPLCSIAMGGRERVWGHISEGVFYIIWFDMQHEICPSNKRNT